jgi:C-terminal processing protease CtpA/Prc
MKSRALGFSFFILLSLCSFSSGFYLKLYAALQTETELKMLPELATLKLQADPSLSVKQALKAGIQTHVPSKSEQGIVGVEFWVPEGLPAYPRIGNVFPDSPAQQAGLYLGDWLLAIDGQPCKGWSRQTLDVAISNVPGTVHQLLVFRKGLAPLRVKLKVASLLSVSARLKQYYSPLP